MYKQKSLGEAYTQCESEGFLIPQQKVDPMKVKTMLRLAKSDLDAIKPLFDTITKESMGWNIVYKTYYDALRQLAAAFIRFDKVKSSNHNVCSPISVKNTLN